MSLSDHSLFDALRHAVAARRLAQAAVADHRAALTQRTPSPAEQQEAAALREKLGRCEYLILHLSEMLADLPPASQPETDG